MKLTDRSRALIQQECPRKRYWAYEYKGQGISVSQLSPQVATGLAVHAGLEQLLKGADVAWAAAVVAQTSAELLPEVGGMAEALFYAFFYRALPALLDEYGVVDVEREEEITLSPNLIFMSRPDALLRRREDGELFIFSLKTGEKWEGRLASKYRYDMQAKSEIAAVEARLKTESAREDVPWPLVRGVQLCHLSRLQFLTEPYWSLKDYRWAHSYEWMDEGGNKRRLDYRTWKRVPISGVMQISEWVGKLHRGEVQPEAGDALEAVVTLPPPFHVTREEIESFLRQIRVQELSVMYKEAIVSDAATLDALFPQHTERCFAYRTACPYAPLCHDGADPEDALNSGLYAYLTPHHTKELIQLQPKGITV